MAFSYLLVLLCSCTQNNGTTRGRANRKRQKFSSRFTIQHTMAVPAITGALKRKIITDISLGFAVGFVLATGYWEFEHKPIVAKRNAYYAELKAKKDAEDAI